jgi:hypothetical protein
MATKVGFMQRNIEVSDEENAGEVAAPVEDDSIAKLMAAHADAVEEPFVINGETVCGSTGKPGVVKRKGSWTLIRIEPTLQTTRPT